MIVAVRLCFCLHLLQYLYNYTDTRGAHPQRPNGVPSATAHSDCVCCDDVRLHDMLWWEAVRPSPLPSSPPLLKSGHAGGVMSKIEHRMKMERERREGGVTIDV